MTKPKIMTFDKAMHKVRLQQIDQVCRRGNVHTDDVARAINISPGRAQHYLRHMADMDWLSVERFYQAGNYYTSTGRLPQEIHVTRHIYKMVDRNLEEPYRKAPHVQPVRDPLIWALFSPVSAMGAAS